MNLKNTIRTIPDYPKPGIMFRDVTTLLGDPRAFRRAVDELVQGGLDRPHSHDEVVHILREWRGQRQHRHEALEALARRHALAAGRLERANVRRLLPCPLPIYARSRRAAD